MADNDKQSHFLSPAEIESPRRDAKQARWSAKNLIADDRDNTRRPESAYPMPDEHHSQPGDDNFFGTYTPPPPYKTSKRAITAKIYTIRLVSYRLT